MWPFRRSQKQVEPTASELVFAAGEQKEREIAAKEHEKLKFRRTIIYLKSGRHLILRGIRLNLRGTVEIQVMWDPTCHVRLAIPWSSIDFIISDEVTDKPPETSIEYRSTLPEGMLPRV